MKDADRKALLGVLAFVVPFIVYTLILILLQRAPEPAHASAAPRWAVQLLTITIPVIAGFVFIFRGWPEQAGLLAVAYFPLMCFVLLAFTLLVLVPLIGIDSL